MILLTILKVIFCSSVMYWYILCDVSSCICFQLGMSDWALWVWNTDDFVIVIIASHWPPSDTERVDPSCDSSVADDLVSLGLKPPWVVVVVVWGGGVEFYDHMVPWSTQPHKVGFWMSFWGFGDLITLWAFPCLPAFSLNGYLNSFWKVSWPQCCWPHTSTCAVLLKKHGSWCPLWHGDSGPLLLPGMWP